MIPRPPLDAYDFVIGFGGAALIFLVARWYGVP